MLWYALYELATGNLRSTGTQSADAETLNSGVFGQVTFNFNIQDPAWTWNPVTHDYDPTPPRLANFSLKIFMENLTQTEREDFFDIVVSGTPANKKRIRVFIEYLKFSDTVDLNNSYVLGELTALETFGIFNAGTVDKLRGIV